MSRFVFGKPGERAPFSKRGRLIRVAGRLMRPGEFGKALRPERGINGRVRRRHSSLVEPEIVEILSDFREAITVAQAEAAVASGRASVIVNALAPNELEAELMSSISHHLENALADGVEIGLRFAPASLGGVPMSLATDAAIASVASSASLAALGVTQTTQAGIAEILKLGLSDQLAPVQVAEKIGKLAGLSPRDVRAVENFRRAKTLQLIPPDPLDPFGRLGPRLFDPDTAAVRAVIDQEVDDYRDRLLLNRGRSIAETEIQNAITTGEQAFWDEAIRDGAADEANVFKTWRTVQDADVCPICAPLHGQTIKMNALFVTSVGAINGPAAHPRCRCYLQYGELQGGQAPSRPDRGMVAVRHQQGDRLLQPAAVREDLQIARARTGRIENRMRKVRPGTKVEATLRSAIGTNAVTIQSLEARLRDLGEIG